MAEKKVPGADHCASKKTVIDILSAGTSEEKEELRKKILASSSPFGEDQETPSAQEPKK